MLKVKMNRINPKTLLNSKWTKVDVANKEKHFLITKVEFDEDKKVTDCIIEAVMTHIEYSIDWHDLKISEKWRMGWK
jgi:tryptophan-rich hypothetical protein